MHFYVDEVATPAELKQFYQQFQFNAWIKNSIIERYNQYAVENPDAIVLTALMTSFVETGLLPTRSQQQLSRQFENHLESLQQSTCKPKQNVIQSLIKQDIAKKVTTNIGRSCQWVKVTFFADKNKSKSEKVLPNRPSALWKFPQIFNDKKQLSDYKTWVEQLCSEQKQALKN